MGTDDLFHKRKAREAESLRRQAAKRAPYDVVLIVCEGEKIILQGLLDYGRDHLFPSELKFSNERKGAVPAIEITSFKGLTFSRTELGQWVKPGHDGRSLYQGQRCHVL